MENRQVLQNYIFLSESAGLNNAKTPIILLLDMSVGELFISEFHFIHYFLLLGGGVDQRCFPWPDTDTHYLLNPGMSLLHLFTDSGKGPCPPPLLLRILQKIYEKNTKIDIQLLFPEPHFAEIGFWPSLSKISRSASDNVKILRE